MCCGARQWLSFCREGGACARQSQFAAGSALPGPPHTPTVSLRDLITPPLRLACVGPEAVSRRPRLEPGEKTLLNDSTSRSVLGHLSRSLANLWVETRFVQHFCDFVHRLSLGRPCYRQDAAQLATATSFSEDKRKVALEAELLVLHAHLERNCQPRSLGHWILICYQQ